MRAADLWRYAVTLYGRPGVAAACLALQDRHGADVPLLLAALWHAARGRGPPDLERWREISNSWGAAAVLPLRKLRRDLKGRPGWEAVRGRVKHLELAAERATLVQLARDARPRIDTSIAPAAVLRAVLGNAARARAARTILAEAAKMPTGSKPSRIASRKA